QNRAVGIVGQGVSEVVAADAVVAHLNTLWYCTPGQAAGDLHAEGVVAQEDVADAGHQDGPPGGLDRLLFRRGQLDFLGREEEAVPGSPRPDGYARIIVHQDGDVEAALDVTLHRRDGGASAGQGEIEDVASRVRAEPHPIAF